MTATTIRVQMAQRKDTAANWTAANPILLSGEIGYETDTKKFKIGNGSSNWNSLAYLPIPDGSGNLTITGNLEIGSTGSLTFEGSTADGFETTLAVTNPTADRTITLPDRSGTVITSGDTGTVTSTMLADGTIVNADISATAEIAVSKLANGTANQIITTDGTDVSWSSNLNLAGNATIQGDLTVNGTTTTIDSQTLLVEDKNIEMGVVATPTDVTADGGGITLRGTTNKTINWIDSTDSWTSSEHVDLTSGKSYRINNTEVLSSTTLGSGVTGSSLTSVGTIGTGVWQGTAISATYLDATLVKTSDTGTVTSTMIANGTIVDADINASAAIADTKLATISTAGKVANSATTATNANTASAIVARDASGNFSAGTITANLTGTASAIADSSVTDAKVSATAAIAGTKISPDFGSQNVTTTGTATAASLIPSSSTVPTNGVYLPAANTVGISTGGSGRLFVDSSGKVGVGTSSATDLLSVGTLGSSTDATITLGSSTTSSGQIYFGDGTGASRYRGYVQYNHSSDSLILGSAGSDRVTVDSSGRLGIGTSSPGQLLEINGASNPCLLLKDTTNNVEAYVFSDDSVANFGSPSAHPVVFRVQNAERMRIDTSGRVGIGTSTPSETLHVAGDMRVGTGVGSGNTIHFSRSGQTDAARIACDANSNLAFHTNAGERFRCDSSGRLLVGTSSARTNFSNSTDDPQLQIESANGFGWASIRNSNTSGGTYVYIAKSRGTGNVIVQNNDIIGGLNFEGNDGSEFVTAAQIRTEVDGTPGANDMPGRLVFSTTPDSGSSPVERMRISSKGHVGIGVTPVIPLQVFQATDDAAGGPLAALNKGYAGDVGTAVLHLGKQDNNSTTSQIFQRFYINAAATGSGMITANGASQATFSSFSDIRLKENIQDLPSQLQAICSLRPVEFDYKDGSGHQIGFIAQEVEEVYPDLIGKADNEMLTLSGMGKHEARLIKAIQELKDELDAAKQRIAALESA